MDSVARISLGLARRGPSVDEGFVVHSHELLEDLQVVCQVVGDREETAEDARLLRG